jgi:methylase of polypeptide subunit release factors
VPDSFPLTLGDADDFARIADHLHAAAYDADTVCGRLGVPALYAADDLPRDAIPLPPAADDALAFLVRTFLLLEPVSEATLAARLDAPARDAFVRLGLLVPDPDGVTWTASVLLYPVGDCHIVSDRHRDRTGRPAMPGPDAVFPALLPGSLLHLRLLPRGTYEDALDLGAGTGIGALELSRRVRRVVASDLTARAAHFARFNQRLNARPNVETVTGDLYAPVAGRTFDCIVSHLPYVPSLDDALVFRDGGPTGERIVQRMVSELPGVLRPGGVLCAVCAGWDTADGMFEERVRGWLGASAGEFDLLLAVEAAREPRELAERLVRPGRDGPRVPAEAWAARFHEAGLVSHVYGALVLGRRAGPGTPATLRTWLASTTRGSDLEEAMARLTARAAQTAAGARARTLDGLYPRRADGLIVHEAHGGRAGEVVLETRAPFRSRLRVDRWILDVISTCDGTRRSSELLGDLRARRVVPDGFTPGNFHQLLEMLLERGYLEPLTA